jgi:BNR/Asp-box repeat
MPDRSLAATREAVQAIVEPTALEQRTPFGDLVERAGRRRHRRWQVAAGVLVIVVAAGLLLDRPVSDKISTPPARPTTQSTPPVTPSNQLLVQSVYFATPTVGWAVIGRCAGPGYRCAAHATVVRTDDGARTWLRVPSPTDAAAGEQVRVDEATSSGGVVLSVGELRYASTDLGRTWQQSPYSPFAGPAVDSVPAGWDVFGVGGKVSALNPLTNQYRPLAHQPPFAHAVNLGTVLNGPTGRILATDDSTGKLRLAYSDDNGRSWHERQLPAQAGSSSRILLTSDSTDRIYFTQGDNDYRVIRIHRLDTIGGSWVPVPVPERVRAEPNPGTMKVIQMLPNGELRYMLDTIFVTSHDGTTLGNAPATQVYRTTESLVANQTIQGTMIATVPAGTDQPADVVAMLFSTDSGRTWELREFRL